jgi:tRNA pseudouridine55 synthase
LTDLDGVLVVDKPAGPTSHDVVERARRALGVRKAGHTGTLDPFATGVLALCLGQATRLVRFLATGDKCYRASVRLGFATTTDDLDGTPLGPVTEPVVVARERVLAACEALLGPQLQLPPAFSAKRVGGRRAYSIARAGDSPALEAAPVTIHRLELLSLEGDRVELELVCSPGTYVRSLARDLGVRLGVGGHLVALRRLSSGAFSLEQSVDCGAIDAGTCLDKILPLARLLPELPSVRVGVEGREALSHGRFLSRRLVLSGFPEAAPPQRLRVLDESGALLALAVPQGFASVGVELPLEPVLHPDVVLLRA